MGLSLRGTTSGAVDINAPAVAGDNTITLPGNNGAANQFYKNSGTAGIVTHSSMVEDSSGRIGIGTDNPDTKLHVEGATAGGAGVEYFDALQLENTQTANVGATRLKFKTNRDGTAGETSISHIPYNASGTAYLRLQSYQYQFYNQAGSSEYLRIDSSGRLLVGTSTARSVAGGQSLLQVESTSSTGRLSVVQNRNDASAGPIISVGKSRGTALGSNTVVQSGDILGTIAFAGADGTDLETVAANIEAYVDGTPGANDMPGRLVFNTTADGASSPTERMRISANGTATFNNTLSANGGIEVVTTIDPALYVRKNGTGGNIIQGRNAGGAEVFKVQQNGDTYNANNVFTALSDIKLKENIVDAKSQWYDIKVLRPVNYNFKAETGQETHTQLGLIAQEVELVSPGLVSESPDRDEDGNDLGTTTKSVNYSVLYMKAVKALQEAMERIETLETQNTSLEARLSALEG